MGNPFEDMASEATRPMQIKLERAARQPMVPSPLEKKQQDQAKQLVLFRQWKREIRQGLIDGTFGPEIVMLMRFLRRVPEPSAMVEWVRGSKWLLNGSEHMRMAVLGYIDHTMTRWNVRHGLPHFTDSLPDEPDSAFIIIRRLLTSQPSDRISINTSRRPKNVSHEQKPINRSSSHRKIQRPAGR